MKRIVLFALSLFLILFFSSCSYSEYDLEQEYEKGYSLGYERGYSEGQDDGYAEGYSTGSEDVHTIYENDPLYGAPVYEEYYEIDGMSTDEILAYLESRLDAPVFTMEETHDIYVLAFQRGYEAHKTGRWDDTTEEYIDGYLFSDSFLDEYLWYFEPA